MDERLNDDNAPEDVEPPVEPGETMDEDVPTGLEPPEYPEMPLDEAPVEIEPPLDDGLPADEPLIEPEMESSAEPSFGAEPLTSYEQVDYGDEFPPLDDGTPTVDLAQDAEEPPTSLEQIDYGDELPPFDDEMPLEDEGPELDIPLAGVESEDYVEPAAVEPPAFAEPPPDAGVPDYATARLVDEGPSGSELYQAFVPRRMRRDRLAGMSYPSAIELVGKWRKRGDPPELGELEMSDEEIAAAIQDYARGVDTEEERTNWLLGQILEEQFRQTRHIRGVKTVLILLIAAMALAAIASCVLTFVQLPGLMP